MKITLQKYINDNPELLEDWSTEANIKIIRDLMKAYAKTKVKESNAYYFVCEFIEQVDNLAEWWGDSIIAISKHMDAYDKLVNKE